MAPAYGKRQGYLSAARLEHTDSVPLPQSLEKAFASKHSPTRLMEWVGHLILPRAAYRDYCDYRDYLDYLDYRDYRDYRDYSGYRGYRRHGRKVPTPEKQSSEGHVAEEVADHQTNFR